MRNGSLWSRVVFEKEVIFHEFDSKTSRLEFEVSKSSIWTHTTPCDKGVFSFIIISQLRRSIELKFSQVCYLMHMLKYTKWEDWSLTITNSVQCLKLNMERWVNFQGTFCRIREIWHSARDGLLLLTPCLHVTCGNCATLTMFVGNRFTCKRCVA